MRAMRWSMLFAWLLTPPPALPAAVDSLQPGDYLSAPFMETFVASLRQTRSPLRSFKAYQRRQADGRDGGLHEIYLTREAAGLVFHPLYNFHEGGFDAPLAADGSVPQTDGELPDMPPFRLEILSPESFEIVQPGKYAARFLRVGTAERRETAGEGLPYALASAALFRRYTIAGQYVDASLQDYRFDADGSADLAGARYQCDIVIDFVFMLDDFVSCSPLLPAGAEPEYWKFRADGKHLRLYETYQNEDEDELRARSKPFLVLRRVGD